MTCLIFLVYLCSTLDCPSLTFVWTVQKEAKSEWLHQYFLHLLCYYYIVVRRRIVNERTHSAVRWVFWVLQVAGEKNTRECLRPRYLRAAWVPSQGFGQFQPTIKVTFWTRTDISIKINKIPETYMKLPKVQMDGTTPNLPYNYTVPKEKPFNVIIQLDTR